MSNQNQNETSANPDNAMAQTNSSQQQNVAATTRTATLRQSNKERQRRQERRLRRARRQLQRQGLYADPYLIQRALYGADPNQELPDLSHIMLPPPPYSPTGYANGNRTNPRQTALAPAAAVAAQSASQQQLALSVPSPGRLRNWRQAMIPIGTHDLARSQFRHTPFIAEDDPYAAVCQADHTEIASSKRCCGINVNQTVSIRWFIVMIAFVGICCSVVGTVLGALKASGREHLTVSLLMIGVGIVLITVSGIAWRLTATDAPSCRAMLGLGGDAQEEDYNNGRFLIRPNLGNNNVHFNAGRSQHPYAAMMYSDFNYRPPPPSYQASMQEYRLRLLLMDRAAVSGGPPTNGPSLAANSNANSNNHHNVHTISRTSGANEQPISPPPQYRAQLRNASSHAAVHSRPPSYHSQMSAAAQEQQQQQHQNDSEQQQQIQSMHHSRQQSQISRNSSHQVMVHESSSNNNDNMISAIPPPTTEQHVVNVSVPAHYNQSKNNENSSSSSSKSSPSKNNGKKRNNNCIDFRAEHVFSSSKIKIDGNTKSNTNNNINNNNYINGSKKNSNLVTIVQTSGNGNGIDSSFEENGTEIFSSSGTESSSDSSVIVTVSGSVADSTNTNNTSLKASQGEIQILAHL